MEAGKYAHKIHYAFMLKRCGRYAATNVVMNQWDPTSFVGHSWLELYALKGTHIQCMHTDATLTREVHLDNAMLMVAMLVLEKVRALPCISQRKIAASTMGNLKKAAYLCCMNTWIPGGTHIYPHYYLVQRAATGQYTAEHSNTTAVELHMKNLL